MLRPIAMLRPVAITALLLAGMAGMAQADVYRWVDEKGEPHYSDRWVPGSELIKSSKPRPQAGDTNSSAESKMTPVGQQHAAEKLVAQQNAQAVKQDVASTREAQCKQAKERYQKAIEARRLYKQAKEGEERVYMSDAETDAYRLQARNDVTEACGTPPPPAQPAQ